MTNGIIMKKILILATVALMSINTAYASLIYSTSNISNNLRDISSTGTQFNLSDDAMTGEIGMGFNFGFYDIFVNTVNVSSNGFLALGGFASDDGCCSGKPLPADDGYNGIIAGLWEDLNTNNNSTGTMFYQTLGAVGSREFVVGFYDVAHFPSSDPVTFEMILHEGSNNIEFQYGLVSYENGTHSVGIENTTGTSGIQYLYGDDIERLSNTGVLFSTTPVSEPSMLAMFAFGLFAMRRLRKNA